MLNDGYRSTLNSPQQFDSFYTTQGGKRFRCAAPVEPHVLRKRGVTKLPSDDSETGKNAVASCSKIQWSATCHEAWYWFMMLPDPIVPHDDLWWFVMHYPRWPIIVVISSLILYDAMAFVYPPTCPSQKAKQFTWGSHLNKAIK